MIRIITDKYSRLWLGGNKKLLKGMILKVVIHYV